MYTFRIEMAFGERSLAIGTCLSVSHRDRWFILTNRHNVTGRHQKTGRALHKLGAVPDRVLVYLPTRDLANRWWVHIIHLYQDDEPVWIEHPTCPQADVVALPFDRPPEARCFGILLDDPFDFRVDVGDAVTAIGYPLGKPEFSLFPQWIPCKLATPHDQPFDEMPAFLIEGETRKGSSGSPVVAHRADASGLTRSDGRPLGTNWATRFLGIYSGRLIRRENTGLVWSLDCVRALVEAASHLKR
ncbi:MAG TPA: trypsin-like peptidase domain-containing protein [Allosphingosinicella sp.]|jgi:hypothetical protein